MNVRMSSSSHRLHSKYLGLTIAREHVMLRYVAAYSPGDALNAILNYWVEELRMNYVALAIALA